MKWCSGRDALRLLRSSVFSSVAQEDMMWRRPSFRARVRLLCLPDTWKFSISLPGGRQIVRMQRLTEREMMCAEGAWATGWSRKSRRQSVLAETHTRLRAGYHAGFDDTYLLRPLTCNPLWTLNPQLRNILFRSSYQNLNPARRHPLVDRLSPCRGRCKYRRATFRFTTVCLNILSRDGRVAL